MTQYPTRNMLLPVFIGSAVLVIALTLLTIVAHGPYTHSNLNVGFDPRYTRTVQTFVGAPIPFTGGGLAVPPASDQVEYGKQLFITKDCATCHGLDGRGGVVGPPIVGTKADKLRAKTTVGPKGMPAYASGALTDEQLAAIAAYLNSISK
ncbi:MAG: cytochrome c [Chloroflexi bacterium]|nr:cytochrome c [Chloroflexota bacterium]